MYVRSIKELRIAAGLTQAELAGRIGVSQATVGMWETGSRTPRVPKLLELSKLLGCSVSDLLEDSPNGETKE